MFTRDELAIVLMQPETLSEAKLMYASTPPRHNSTRYFADPHLDPTFKTEWTKALRSGKYEQGRGNLKAEVFKGEFKYCCLGVRCELSDIPSSKTRAHGIWGFRFGDGSLKTTIPFGAWAESVGMDSTGSFQFQFTLFGKTFYQLCELAGLNDQGFTFDQIADLIDYFF